MYISSHHNCIKFRLDVRGVKLGGAHVALRVIWHYLARTLDWIGALRLVKTAVAMIDDNFFGDTRSSRGAQLGSSYQRDCFEQNLRQSASPLVQGALKVK